MAKQESKYGWNIETSYTQLPDAFYARVKPTAVRAPKIVAFNHELAKNLGLNSDALESNEGANFFSGNETLPGSEPIAQAYAGHQFGYFTMLGDGRAHLLGEHLTPDGRRVDIQLKGSGPTPFSRRGDGRAALGPMLREYIISETMHALGIPTTRSLAVVATGEPVYREKELPGAILTRVAQSHIRVGTFEFAVALNKGEHLRTLADYTILRHYPEIQGSDEPYLELLKRVIDRQAFLVSRWLLVGFIHGVMNTDNMTLSGETIDYGPCAFMDRYSRATVFSSIDRQGRYAYGNQPGIAEWNLTRLAESLLPLLDENEEKAIAKAEEAIVTFGSLFESHWVEGMRSKLGLQDKDKGDLPLITSLLDLMEKHQADYTNTFRALSLNEESSGPLFQDASFVDWKKAWLSRSPVRTLMLMQNPAVIARNHRVEEALSAAVDRGDFSVMEHLLTALRSPFDEPANLTLRDAPPSNAADYQTFCGT